MNKHMKELSTLSTDALQSKLNDLRRERFSLLLNAHAAHVKDYSQFFKLRKNIARIKTILSSRNAAHK